MSIPLWLVHRTMPEEINRLATDAISDLLLVFEPDGRREADPVSHSSPEELGAMLLLRDLGSAKGL